jgi:TrmH family RNA methyltransferase
MNKITAIKAENAEFQIIRALKLNREKRNKLREIFIEGVECIKQAVKCQIEITRIISADIEGLSGWGKELIKKNKNAKIIEMPVPLFNSLCDKSVPAELLVTAKINRNELTDINIENPFIVVFDRPSDYGNLGTLIRSANAFGVDGIIIIGHGIDVYESKVIRSSLGSVFSTKVVDVDSMDALKGFIEVQKGIQREIQKSENSLQITGTDSAGEDSLADVTIKKPVMLIVGNEAKGMSVKLKALCDRVIRIPMGGAVNSLNVSCAASILMWEIYKNSH